MVRPESNWIAIVVANRWQTSLSRSSRPVPSVSQSTMKSSSTREADRATAGDIIIDGGNSHYPDTNRRTKYLAEKGIRYVGCGVSGGEEGARYGPSIMPGGNEEAWPYIKDVLQSISAKSDDEPCCQWVGDEGAGHYVKMVSFLPLTVQICRRRPLTLRPGPQRYRVRRHAAHHRGLRHHEAWSWSEQQGDG